MAEERVQRKLTTILAADVEGYTRLMRADEEATLGTLTEYREITDNLIARRNGRIFSTAGDSVVAEFGSAVEAVRCAVEIQEELKVRNAEQPDDRRMRFRIGINVGDVMVRDGDLFGDGVNVAARIEGLCGPGEVYVSGSVHGQVEGKLSLGFEDMGEQAGRQEHRQAGPGLSGADQCHGEHRPGRNRGLPDAARQAVHRGTCLREHVQRMGSTSIRPTTVIIRWKIAALMCCICQHRLNEALFQQGAEKLGG